MTDKTITPDDWLYIANEVEPEYEWSIFGKVNMAVGRYYQSIEGKAVKDYKPKHRTAQQLRLADYLAEKGATVFWNTDEIDPRFTCLHGCDYLAEHADINLCRALAVLALIGGRE